MKRLRDTDRAGPPEARAGAACRAAVAWFALLGACVVRAAAPGTEDASLRNPEVRGRAVAEIRRGEDARRAEAERRAALLGLPLRGAKPGGGAWALAEFDGVQFLYRTTLNANAAISTGANLLRAAPYGADGTNFTVGVWDASSARTTHQEFGGRVTTKDGAAASSDHSTHVVGTVCAAGVDPAARGMASAARVDSYDWFNDLSEMTARGAAYPAEPGMINISSHSYSIFSGWVYTGPSAYTWYGSGTDANGVEDDFGKYATQSRDVDALAYGLPYYLVFWAAGNDRSDNPANGNSVALSPGGPTVTYDSTLHPPGDRVYRGGYDTVSVYGVAKNILTIGAVTDAVSGGQRSVSAAAMTSFSSWGPTDDGRVKPDLVANGYYLKSTSNISDTDYSTMYGTSMATPNAAGTAQQLVHWFHILFTNQTLRAATLKAVLIHTADDKGTPGPDYQYGWGLLNGKAAADLLAAYRTNAGTRRVVEDRLTASRASRDVAFAWDGTSPIRATLCWSDPAGAATTAHDSRTPRLVNNLDLRLLAPDGSVLQPWVMPFVGDWSAAAFGAAATAGSNATDNVEQVLLAAPPGAGVYTARVTFAGTLANGEQPFSLILSGVSPLQQAPAPLLTASSPASGTGTLRFTLAGDHFMLGGSARLRRRGQPDVPGANLEVRGDQAEAYFNTAGMAGGWWKMTFTNPDGRSATLWNAFAIPEPFWSEDFETDDIATRGWTFSSDIGASQWAPTTAKSVSPARSMFSPGVATRSDTSLVSPGVMISAAATNLTLSFWHDFAFAANDAGVLEFSLDDGAWFDVVSSGSGAAFAQNGYTGTVGGNGAPTSLNPLKGRSAWTGANGGFAKVVVNLSDTAKYAGRALRVRWRLGTDSATASAGWHVDDVALSAIGAPPPLPVPGTLMRVR